MRVNFGTRRRIGIVSKVNVDPPEGIGRIPDIGRTGEEIEPISPEELELWTFLSEYCLCSRGEVYKAACPSGKVRQEQVSARIRQNPWSGE